MRAASLLLALLLLGAGCIGGQGEEDGIEPTDQDPPEDPGPEDASTTTREETVERTGSVTTAGLVVARLNTMESDTIQEFTVADGTSTLYLNLTASGGELDMLIAEPGCEFNSGCEETVSTEGGTATVTITGPADGGWGLRFFGNAPGPSTADYTVAIAQVVIAEA